MCCGRIYEQCHQAIELKPSFFVQFLDQYQYLSNCPPTPPLTQQQSIDNNIDPSFFLNFEMNVALNTVTI